MNICMFSVFHVRAYEHFQLMHTDAHKVFCQTQAGSPFSPEDEAVSFLAATGPSLPDRSNWRSSLMWSTACQLLIATHICTKSDHRTRCCIYPKKIIRIDRRSCLTAFYKYHTRLLWLCNSANLQWPHLIFNQQCGFLKYWCHGRRCKRNLSALSDMKVEEAWRNRITVIQERGK